MPTPPTRVSFTKTNNTSAVNTLSSSAVSWLAGDLIVVIAGGAGSVSTPLNTPTASGLTFTVIASNGSSTAHAEGMIATATAGANGSGAITVTVNSGEFYNFGVWVFRNHNGAGQHASLVGSSSAVNVAMASLQADSAICWMCADWSAGAATRTGVPTPTNNDMALLVSGQYTVYLFDLTDQPSTGSVNYGVNGSAANNLTFYVLEIEGIAAAGGSRISYMGNPGMGFGMGF